ncbi:MAG TPA: MBL fold metallo-hydrolase, partial [Gammaproteobacteria bacterium]|nr:MBL fold metallo-hydrolase [Gammaproteobacteria bacterium]
MNKHWTAAATVAALALASSSASAQSAAAVIANASKAMGADGLNSITYSGAAANYNLGQNNNANYPWPRNNVNDYRRTIDFTRPASLATGVTYGQAVTGGFPTAGAFTQNITPQSQAWAQQLEIWVTPWGFLKGAAAHNATVAQRTIGGERFNVVTWEAPVKAPSGVAYKLVGYVNGANLVTRVDTWLENPIFGDMLVESDYGDYRDKNGLKYPTAIVQKRGGWPTFDAQISSADANPSNLDALLTPPPGGGGGPPPGGGAPPAASSEKLADGVYRITGGYVALAVEMRDYIVLYEPAGQNEARAQAVFAEVKRVIPGKPIKYGVLSHHHFDHTSGLPAVVAEGVTIVTHEANKKFFEAALAAPRTLAPDSMAKSGKKPVIETMTDKRVFSDGTRTFEIHEIRGLPHADGMLIGYLPKENIVVFADMFNLPAAGMPPVPNPPVIGTQVFVANLERIGIKDARIVSVHAPNPD